MNVRHNLITGLLLFTAAFILPDTCCSLATKFASGSKAAGSEIAEVSHQFMLVSSSGTTSAATKLGVAKLGVWSDDQQSQNPGCENGDCLHVTTYSRPLLTALELQEQLGATGARTLIQAQPYLSPLGGLFLIVAHVMNIGDYDDVQALATLVGDDYLVGYLRG